MISCSFLGSIEQDPRRTRLVVHKSASMSVHRALSVDRRRSPSKRLRVCPSTKPKVVRLLLKVSGNRLRQGHPPKKTRHPSVSPLAWTLRGALSRSKALGASGEQRQRSKQQAINNQPASRPAKQPASKPTTKQASKHTCKQASTQAIIFYW